MEVLRRAATGGPIAGLGLVERVAAPRSAAGAVRDRCGNAGRSCAARRSAGGATRRRRSRVRAPASALALAPGDRGESWQPHRLMALRRADDDLRAAAWHGDTSSK